MVQSEFVVAAAGWVPVAAAALVMAFAQGLFARQAWCGTDLHWAGT